MTALIAKISLKILSTKNVLET